MRISSIKTQSLIMAGILVFTCNAFSAEKTITIEGELIVGTLDSNIDAGNVSAGFMTQSDIGNQIFEKCGGGDKCKVTSVVDDNGFIKSLISVEKVGDGEQITLNATDYNNDKTKPSFDCSKASTFVEKSICADKKLSDMDNVLMSRYKKAYVATKDQELLKNEQKYWLKNVRNVCKNNKCIEDAYIDRLLKLNINLDKNQGGIENASEIKEKDMQITNQVDIDKSIRIKGFYIGMLYEKACENVAKISEIKRSEVIEIKNPIQCSGKHYLQPKITADESGSVINIILNRTHFGSNADSKGFIQEFADNYKLNLKFLSSEPRGLGGSMITYYQHTGDNEFIQVSDGGSVQIIKRNKGQFD